MGDFIRGLFSRGGILRVALRLRRAKLALLISLCLPAIASAQTDVAGILTTGGIGWSAFRDATYHIFVTRFGDLSTQLLSRIFGTMGGVLPVGVEPVTAQLFRIFNLGIWAVAGGIIAYVTIRGIVDTSREGSMLGQQTQGTLAFRVVAGLVLLMPKYTGYSVIQILVMWAVLQGVNLANNTWDSFVNYFISGGSAQVQLQAPNPDEMQTLIKTGVTDMLRSTTCMYAVKASEQAARRYKDRYLKAHPDCQTMQCTLYRQDIKTSRIYHVKQDPAHPSVLFFGGNTDKTQGICGVYEAKVDADAAYQESKSLSMIALAHDLSPIGEEIYRFSEKQPISSTNITEMARQYPACLRANDDAVKAGEFCPLSDRIQTAALAYIQSMAPARLTRLQAKVAGTAGSDIFAKAKAKGWMSAGMYHRRFLTVEQSAKQDPDTDYLFSAKRGLEPPYVAPTHPQTHLGLEMSNKARKLQLKEAIRTLHERNLIFSLSMLGNPYANQNYLTQAHRIYEINYTRTQFGGDDFDWKEPPRLTAGDMVGRFFLPKITMGFYKAGPDPQIKYFKTHKSLFDRIVKAREDAVKDIVPDGVHTVGEEVVNLWINSWKAWKAFSNPQERTGDPVEDLRVFGIGLMSASIRFWANVTQRILETVSTLSAVFMVFSILTGVVGGVILTLAEKVEMLAMAIPIPFAVLIPTVVWPLRAVGRPIAEVPGILSMMFQVAVAILLFYLPVGLATAVPIFMMGLILGVYLPLIPFLLFAFASLGWLMAVIEAIAAAPLVALGITYPVGHDFLGRSEIALMLILNVFIRPVAMIIGLAAAMILSFVILAFLNDGFTHLLALSVNFLSGQTSAIIFISSVGLILIYTFVVMTVVSTCYAMIYKIPAQLARWIGAPPEPAIEADLLEKVKSGLTNFGEGVASGIGEMASGARSGIKPTGDFSGNVAGGVEAWKDSRG